MTKTDWPKFESIFLLLFLRTVTIKIIGEIDPDSQLQQRFQSSSKRFTSGFRLQAHSTKVMAMKASQSFCLWTAKYCCLVAISTIFDEHLFVRKCFAQLLGMCLRPIKQYVTSFWLILYPPPMWHLVGLSRTPTPLCDMAFSVLQKHTFM